MKKIFSLALVIVMMFTLAASSEPMPGGSRLIFTTGGAQGTYYGFGGVLAGKVGEKTSTTVTAITSGGSKANIEAMQDGDAHLGFVQTDVGAYAYKGTRLFDEKVSDFSTVANLYMEQVQIVTLDPTIKTVDDLKGKNVSVGAAGSGVTGAGGTSCWAFCGVSCGVGADWGCWGC